MVKSIKNKKGGKTGGIFKLFDLWQAKVKINNAKSDYNVLKKLFSKKEKKGGKRKAKKRTLRKRNHKGGNYSKLAKKAIIKNASRYPKIHVARFEKIDPKDLITKRTLKVYPKFHPGRYGGGKKTMKKKRRKRRRKNKKKRTIKKSRRKR